MSAASALSKNEEKNLKDFDSIYQIYKKSRSSNVKFTLLDNLNYIITTAKELSTKEDDLKKIIKYFEENYKKTSIKKDVNKMLFGCFIGDQEGSTSKIPNQIKIDGFEELLSNIKENHIGDYEANYRVYKNNAEYFMKRYIENLSFMSKFIHKNKKDYIKHLTDQFLIISGNENYKDIYFNTKNSTFHAVISNPVIIEEINFGYYDIVYAIDDDQLCILPYENNIVSYLEDDEEFDSAQYHAQYHPHIWEHGTMCFGSATAAIQESMEAGIYAKVYDLIEILLRSYNPPDSILNVEYFKEKTPLTMNIMNNSEIRGEFLHKNHKITDTNKKAA